MLRSFAVSRRRWPLKAPFRISRGVKTAAETVMVELRRGDAVGRGEAVPYPRYGESVEGVATGLPRWSAASATNRDFDRRTVDVPACWRSSRSPIRSMEHSSALVVPGHDVGSRRVGLM